MYDWDSLKEKIKKFGMRNSLLVAPMPTASTSQILGNNETIEPFTSNIYTRRVLSGEFICVNKFLINDLIKLNLWDDNMKNTLMAHNGSVQNISQIPDDLKKLYKTVWEIPQKTIIDLAADRAPFVDQSQSLNIHMSNLSFNSISSMHFYGWKRGLKTGMYYLRSRSASDAIKFTVDTKIMKKLRDEKSQNIAEPEENNKKLICSLKRPKREGESKKDYEDEECLACGS